MSTPIYEIDFIVYDFGSDNKMGVYIDKRLSKEEVVRLRDWLTEEINRVQAPVAELLKNVQSNVSQS